jgi:hypothetical protein
LDNTTDPNNVLKEGREFENKFREKGSSTKLKKDFSPEEIMVELGFKKIKFSELEKGLQKALKKKDAFRWHGYPVDFGGKVDARHHTIMSNEDGSVLYFFHNKSNEGRKTYGCSRLAKLENYYCVEQLSHNFNIGEIISAVSLQEIITKKTITGDRCGLNHIEIPTE